MLIVHSLNLENKFWGFRSGTNYSFLMAFGQASAHYQNRHKWVVLILHKLVTPIGQPVISFPHFFFN